MSLKDPPSDWESGYSGMKFLSFVGLDLNVLFYSFFILLGSSIHKQNTCILTSPTESFLVQKILSDFISKVLLIFLHIFSEKMSVNSPIMRYKGV